MKILIESSDRLLLFIMVAGVLAGAWFYDPGHAVVLGAVLLELLRAYSSE